MKKIAATTTAFALMAAPAFAGGGQSGETPTTPKGKSTAPGQICKGQSKKKTMKGKGKSPFAACVVGVKRVNKEAAAKEAAEQPKTDFTAPGQVCKDQSKKKSSTDKKSPFAACVVGATKAADRHEDNEQTEQTKPTS